MFIIIVEAALGYKFGTTAQEKQRSGSWQRQTTSCHNRTLFVRMVGYSELMGSSPGKRAHWTSA